MLTQWRGGSYMIYKFINIMGPKNTMGRIKKMTLTWCFFKPEKYWIKITSPIKQLFTLKRPAFAEVFE